MRVSIQILVALLSSSRLSGLVNADLVGIPTVPFTNSQGDGFAISRLGSIIVDTAYASSKDEEGSTLIPPSLVEFATTFSEDLHDIFGIRIPVSTGHTHQENSIYLTIDREAEYLDARYEASSEGYTVTAGTDGIVISGASPLGAWWGTRTVLQQAILNDGVMPPGSGVDTPGWPTRGMMLDCGRQYYPPAFIMDMCSYMSFFKMNTFHMHLSDNLYANPNYTYDQLMELYARFRLYSPSPSVAGLVKYTNESYTRDEFEAMQRHCSMRGVTILPEIEAPGHALSIVQWKPQLGYDTDLSLLNITHPETMPTMKAIWEEFLPWMHSKVVSIGADEYTGPAEEYNMFVNEMDSFIGETSGKSIRIWGTFPPVYNSTYNNIDKNVSIQHWEYFEDNPYFDYIRNGYHVVNSNDDFYVVQKWSGSYPQTINQTKVFHGSPDGEKWYPYIFNQNNVSDNPFRNNSFVLGAIEAQWNDYGSNASVCSEAYYSWREGIPSLADKHWGGNLTWSDFADVFPKLHPSIPAQDLERAIPSRDSTILDYSFDKEHQADGAGQHIVRDASQNGYDATTTCRQDGSALSITPDCSLTTPWSSKGRNYTLSMTLKVDGLPHGTNTTIITGADSTLMLTPNITLYAGGNYFRLNSTIPRGQWVDLSLIGRGNQTFATVVTSKGGKLLSSEEFLTVMGINGDYHVWDIMAIEAPVKEVTGWTGQLARLSLSSLAEQVQ
ncbi:hexosaminidase [Geosmithia morbida]|uniref:beta-N-acetylhexosaminidase n=1 Tax=Geosmithia morbida TaxID=1094350 RepID=A0A9P5CZR8_9HYPO|nr:hexosaminidase [Geosmithia morbida]KAF4120812.1 hexosaminidase [Geosmithia morbida]